jgi:hypothetical protein
VFVASLTNYSVDGFNQSVRDAYLQSIKVCANAAQHKPHASCLGGWLPVRDELCWRFLQDANAPTNVDIVILDVTSAPAGGIAVSTRVTYPDGSASSAPAVSLASSPAVSFEGCRLMLQRWSRLQSCARAPRRLTARFGVSCGAGVPAEAAGRPRGSVPTRHLHHSHRVWHCAFQLGRRSV